MAYEQKPIEPANTNTATAYSGESKATHPGKLGDHALGGAVGAAVGGVAGAAAIGAASGAAAGSPVGPLGVIAGAGIGGVVGALAGKGIAQVVNPTTEDAYWSEHYRDRPYIEENADYNTYRPAYRHGVDAYTKYEGRNFDEIEPQLRSAWEKTPANTMLPWDKAKSASRDAFERLRYNNDNITDEDIDTRTGD